MSNKNKNKSQPEQKPLAEATGQELENIAGDEKLAEEVLGNESAAPAEPAPVDEPAKAEEPAKVEEPAAPVVAPKVEDLPQLSAKRKQVVIDLAKVRKDPEGHEQAKLLEKELEELDAKLTVLKEEQLRKKEKLQLKSEIGKPVVVPSLIKSPESAGGISDSQIPEMFKFQLKAPSSVAFDLVKICGILEQAAVDIYFAHDSRSPVIQQSIKILASLSKEISEELIKAENERVSKLAQK